MFDNPELLEGTKVYDAKDSNLGNAWRGYISSQHLKSFPLLYFPPSLYWKLGLREYAEAHCFRRAPGRMLLEGSWCFLLSCSFQLTRVES